MSEPDAGLFPAIEPFDHGLLEVGDGHRVRYEQCGNPDGLPVLFIHGGPASGFAVRQRRFFDPQRYRIVLLDQRGSGASTPHGERNANTTIHLLADMDQLRQYLKIDQWLLFGGSWGSSLALAWASKYPAHTLGLVLRGVFLTGQADMDWFFRDAGSLMPDAWANFAGYADGFAPGVELLTAYTQALEEPASAAQACAHWMAWEMSLTRPGGKPSQPVRDSQVSDETVRKYRLQAAYLNRLCDLGEESVLESASRVSLLPTAIVHGRLDWVCRAHNAWKVHQRISGSRLRLVDQAGHDPYSPQMLAALIHATNCFARHQNFSSLESEWIVQKSL